MILALFTAISIVSGWKRNMAWYHLSCLCAYKLSMRPDVFELSALTNLLHGLMSSGLSVCLQTCYRAWCHLNCLCAYKLATWPDVFELSVLTNSLHGLMSLSCLYVYKLATWPDVTWVVCVLTNSLHGLISLSCPCLQTCFMAWYHLSCLCAHKLTAIWAPTKNGSLRRNQLRQ